MITHLDRLINAGLLILDDTDPKYYSTYVVHNGHVLLDEDSCRIVLVQVLHDTNDRVCIFLEGNLENPQNVERDDALQIRIFKEITITDKSL